MVTGTDDLHRAGRGQTGNVQALCVSGGQGWGGQEMSRLSVSLVGRAGARRETIGANSEE